MGKIRICIADDHPVVREGLIHIINSIEDMTVVSQCKDVLSAIAKLRKIPCDILILDLQLPGGDGLEVIKAIREMNLTVRVLILSFQQEAIHGLRCYKAGANGYLQKESAADLLLDAIRTIHNGRHYFSDVVLEQIASSKDESENPLWMLTEREYSIASQLVEGYRNREIAQFLEISEKTVSTHRKNLLEKLSITSVLDLKEFWERNQSI